MNSTGHFADLENIGLLLQASTSFWKLWLGSKDCTKVLVYKMCFQQLKIFAACYNKNINSGLHH
jgi:hypothetical protein